MGAVWLAEDTRLHRQVALKTVRPADAGGAGARERLMREARAAASLNHPHIATVHDVLDHEDQVIIVLEYVDGETLHTRIKRGPLPPPEAVEIAIQIAKALSAAHSHGIVHRDLKPANVIVSEGGHAKVLDFGLARLLDLGSTQTAAARVETAGVIGFVGTPGYAAPEQMVSSGVDERADLYALGVVLFEMIGGRRPFPGNDPLQLATTKLSQDAPPLTSTGKLVPAGLERLVAELLERDPADRPASAADVVTRLRDIYGAPGSGALAAARVRRLWTAIAAAALIAVLAGFGVWELGRFARPPIDPSAPPVVAVVPLANDSGDPGKDYLAAGIAESLISSLASLPSVTVLSRAAVAEARTRAKDEASMAKDLGATYVVNGSVQESNGTLRISLHLVKPDRTVAWGDSVEGTFDRIFDLQSRLASALGRALSVQVSAAAPARLGEQPTGNPDALAAYYRGRALLERRDIAGNVDAALAAFDEAIRLDDNFAVAAAARGEALWAKYLDVKDPAVAQAAIEAGTLALRKDPDNVQVRFSLALTLAGTGRNAEAMNELQRVLAAQPNHDDARVESARILAGQGRIDDAIVEFNRAIAVRPQYWGHYNALGRSLLQAARYAEAEAAFRKVIELQPDSYIGYAQLGVTLHTLGRYDDALARYERAFELNRNPLILTNIGAIHHVRGDYAKAVAAYRQVLTLRKQDHITERNLGDALRRLGDEAEARAAYGRSADLVRKALEVNPRDLDLLSTLAVLLAKLGQKSAAIAAADQAAAAGPKDPRVLLRQAQVYTLLGSLDAALTSLDRAVANGVSVSRIEDEEDFEPLRKLPRYSAIVKPRP
jgi:tetratricopeptide (TPR) repeat protein